MEYSSPYHIASWDFVGPSSIRSNITKDDNSKIESDLKFENADVRSNITKVTSKPETKKLQYAEFEKYNTIVKGELTQFKQHLEKLYSTSELNNEQIYFQRPYDKTGLGYLE